MPKVFHRYQLRPKAGTQYHLCPQKDVETALELAAVKIENPQSVAYVPGRTFTFSQSEEIPAEKAKTLLEFLTYCGEFELIKIL